MKPASKPNPLLEIAITIIVPAIVLMKLSGPDSLGPLRALMLGLAFPLSWGLWDGWRRRRLNWLAVLGVVSMVRSCWISATYSASRSEPRKVGEVWA